MTRRTNIIGLVSLRRSLICRTFTLLFLALIVSPFNAPFATFDLVAIVDLVESGEESVKTAVDVAVQDPAPHDVPSVVVREFAALESVESQTPTSFQAVLRI